MIVNFFAAVLLILPGYIVAKKTLPRQDEGSQWGFALLMGALLPLLALILLSIFGVKNTFGTLGVATVIISAISWQVLSRIWEV